MVIVLLKDTIGHCLPETVSKAATQSKLSLSGVFAFTISKTIVHQLDRTLIPYNVVSTCPTKLMDCMRSPCNG